MQRLGDYIDQIRGVSYKPADVRDENAGIAILRANNIQDKVDLSDLVYVDENKVSDAQFLKKGDVLICASSGSKNLVGKAVLIPNDMNASFGAFCKVVRIKQISEVNSDFIRMFFLSKNYRNAIAECSIGANINNIKSDHLNGLGINIPNYDIQCSAVDYLTKLKQAIDLKRKQLLDLDELVKSKFQEMFGDVDSYKCLRDYSLLITKGASPRWQGLTYQDSGVLFITSENVREGYLDISKAKYLDDGINKLLPRSVLQKGDILINIVGASIGRAAVFDIDQLANINQAVALVRPIENGIDIHFLIEYLNSQRAMELYDSMKQGGARDNLSLKNIADLLIPDVSAFKQKEFSGLVRKRNELKEIVIKEIADLEELMDSKMDEYFG